MSDATKQGVEDAIRAHIADEMDGTMLIGYAAIAVGVNSEKMESTAYMSVYPSDQPWHASAGLVAALERDVQDAWGQVDDD